MNEQPDYRPQMHPAYFEEEVHLRDYIKVLRRRWKVLVFTFAAVFAVTALYTFGMRPVYEAETLLQVTEGSRTPAILGELAALSTGTNAVETEMEILKSRSLGAEVVRALGLDIGVYPENGFFSRVFGRLNKRSTSNVQRSTLPLIEVLTVPAELVGEELELRFDGSGDYRLLYEKTVLLEGTVGRAAERNGVRLNVAAERAFDEKARFILIRKDIRKATADLLGNLKVSQVGRNTGVVRVTYRGTDPGSAAAVLETLNRLYVHRDVQDTARDAVAALDFITGQVGQVKVHLDKAQSKLDDYKVQTGAVALSQEAELLVQRVSDLEVEINRLTVRQAGLKSLVGSIREGSAALASGAAALDIESPELARLVTDYSGMIQRRTELLREFTPQNPAVANLDGQIELASGQIEAVAAAILSGTNRREEAVKGVLETYRKQLAKLPEVERSLAKLAKDVMIQEKIYSFLLEKEQETRLLKASTVSNIRIVDPPTVPIEPIQPKTRRNLLLGLILGMMLGIGGSFFLEYFDDTVKSGEDLEPTTGVSLYGSVQFVKEAKDRRKKQRPHLVIEEPRSSITEAFRILRTNITFSRVKESPKVVTVSSPGPGEGKSFIVANLAALSSYGGKRTLVIDADLRKPQQHVVFGASEKPGLTEVITGKMTFEDALQKSPQGKPDLLAAGSIPPNPSELLGSAEMSGLLEGLREAYDFIIIDTPPLGLVTDPSLLMKVTDLGLIVARAGVTAKPSVTQTVDSLRKFIPDLQLGIVVNAIKYMRGYGYRYKYTGYGGK